MHIITVDKLMKFVITMETVEKMKEMTGYENKIEVSRILTIIIHQQVL